MNRCRMCGVPLLVEEELFCRLCTHTWTDSTGDFVVLGLFLLLLAIIVLGSR